MLMNRIQQRFASFLSEDYNALRLFYIGYAILLFAEFGRTTMFPISSLVRFGCFGLAIVCFLLKMILFDHYQLKELVFLVGLLLSSVLAVLFSGSIQPILWAFLLLAAKDVPIRSFVKIYVCMVASFMLFAYVCSMLGVIDNLQYLVYTTDGEEAYRNSFGIIYPTDFAAHMFFLFLGIYYLIWDRLRWYQHILTGILAIIIYNFCIARLDTISMGILALVFGIAGYVEAGEPICKGHYTYKKNRHSALRAGKGVKRHTGNFWESVSVFILPFFVLLSFLSAALFDSSNEFLQEMNNLFSSRLDLGRIGLEEYGFSWFGQDIPMIGGGGSTVWSDEYFFIDCSYLYIFLCYGLIFSLFVLFCGVKACWKFRKDHAFILCMLLISINCVVAHHLIDLAFHPFMAVLWCTNSQVSKTEGTSLASRFKKRTSKYPMHTSNVNSNS